MGQRDDLVAAARRLRKRVADALGRSRQLDPLNLLDLLQATLHLAGLPCLGPKPLDEPHLPLDLALLPGRGRLLDLQHALARNQVFVIVALHENNPVFLDGENPGRDLVQECAVVGRDDHCAPEGSEVLLEPQVCIEIKMIGRLVQEQEVGLPEQQPGKARPHDPAAAELTHRPHKVALLEAEARQNRLGLVLPVAAARGLQRHLKPAEALHQRGLLRRVTLRREGLAGGFDAVAEGDRVGAGVQHLLKQGLVGERCRLLPEIADGQVALPRNTSGVRLDVAREDVHQSGLAGAVGADKRDAVTGGNNQAEAAEQRPSGVGLADFRCD